MSPSFLMSALATSALLSRMNTALAQQTTVIDLPFFGYDSMPIDASVITVQNQVTTLSLNCAPGTDADECGLFPQQTLTIGPSTYNMYVQDGSGYTGTQQCAVTATASLAVCAESAAGSEANFPGSSTTTYNGTDYTTYPVTVTAGASAMGAAAVSASTTTSSASSASTTVSSASSASATSSPAVIGITGTATSSHATTSASSSAAQSTVSSKTTSASPTASTGAAFMDAVVPGGARGVVAFAAAICGMIL